MKVKITDCRVSNLLNVNLPFGAYADVVVEGICKDLQVYDYENDDTQYSVFRLHDSFDGTKKITVRVRGQVDKDIVNKKILIRGNLFPNVNPVISIIQSACILERYSD
jgi:hypothetical protein